MLFQSVKDIPTLQFQSLPVCVLAEKLLLLIQDINDIQSHYINGWFLDEDSSIKLSKILVLLAIVCRTHSHNLCIYWPFLALIALILDWLWQICSKRSDQQLINNNKNCVYLSIYTTNEFIRTPLLCIYEII